jgi:hypothetical protein
LDSEAAGLVKATYAVVIRAVYEVQDGVPGLWVPKKSYSAVAAPDPGVWLSDSAKIRSALASMGRKADYQAANLIEEWVNQASEAMDFGVGADDLEMLSQFW